MLPGYLRFDEPAIVIPSNLNKVKKYGTCESPKFCRSSFCPAGVAHTSHGLHSTLHLQPAWGVTLEGLIMFGNISRRIYETVN